MRVKKEKRRIGLFLTMLFVFLFFLAAVSNLEQGQKAQGKEQLEAALRRAAVACYAAEGAYPPDVEYLQEHYGIRINDTQYTVIYEVIASNLMPDITVLKRVQ